jgi:hypothetical protein
MFPFSGEGKETTILLGPLERANLNHLNNIPVLYCFLFVQQILHHLNHIPVLHTIVKTL